jgi:hypothetical protein
MPNFEADDAGLVLRLGVAPPRAGERRLGAVLAPQGDPVFADVLALRPEAAAWRRRFDAAWPAGSDAALSYGRRIAEGPAYRPADALRR